MLDFDLLNKNLEINNYDTFLTKYKITTPVIGCDERQTKDVMILCAVYYANFEQCKLSHHNALWDNDIQDVQYLYTLVNISDIKILKQKLNHLPVLPFLHWLTAKKLAAKLNIQAPIIFDGLLCGGIKQDKYVSAFSNKESTDVLITFDSGMQITYGDYQQFLIALTEQPIYQIVKSETKILATGLADSFCGKLSTDALVLPKIAYKSQNLKSFYGSNKAQPIYKLQKITVLEPSYTEIKRRAIPFRENTTKNCHKTCFEFTVEQNRIVLTADNQITRTFNFNPNLDETSNLFYFFHCLYNMWKHETQKKTIELLVDKTQFDVLKDFFLKSKDTVNLHDVYETLRTEYVLIGINDLFKWLYKRNPIFYLKLAPKKHVDKIKLIKLEKPWQKI